MNRDLVIVVDPCITGNAFAYIAAQRGYRCIEVWSSMTRLRDCRRMVNHDLYTDMLVHEPGRRNGEVWHKLVEERHAVAAVVPGSDTAHYVAEELGWHMGFSYNGTSPYLRANRRALTMRLGEPCAEGDHAIKALLAEYGRIVVKPQASTGGYDNVTVVTDSKETPATSSVRDMFAQPYYEGTEYAVDVVAYKGQYRLCAVWRYEKPEGSIVNDRIRLIHPTDEPMFIASIFGYAMKVLQTAEFSNGAAHLEIMECDGQLGTTPQYRLIEANFRNHGHLDLQTLWRIFDRENQVNIWVDAYLKSEFTPSATYAPMTHARRIFVINDRPRKGRDIENTTNQLILEPGVSKLWRQHASHETMPIGDYTWRNVMINALLVGPSEEYLDRTEEIVRYAYK